MTTPILDTVTISNASEMQSEVTAKLGDLETVMAIGNADQQAIATAAASQTAVQHAATLQVLEQTRGARHCSTRHRHDQKRRASRQRRRDERAAIKRDRDPLPRHTKGWAD